MPWSISPRLAHGSSRYSLLSSHVFSGDGRSVTMRAGKPPGEPGERDPDERKKEVSDAI